MNNQELQAIVSKVVAEIAGGGVAVTKTKDEKTITNMPVVGLGKGIFETW